MDNKFTGWENTKDLKDEILIGLIIEPVHYLHNQLIWKGEDCYFFGGGGQTVTFKNHMQRHGRK